MKKLISKKTVYNDNETGLHNNITGEIYEKKGVERRITVEELFEYDIKEPSSKPFMTDITFIKSFRGNGIMLTQMLTYAEIAAVVFICDFICYEDCVLRENGIKKGRALSVRDLSDLIGIKYETFRKTIMSLKNKEVIGFHSTGENKNATRWITVNPYIFCRGIKIERWVVEFYANTSWAKIERQKVRVIPETQEESE